MFPKILIYFYETIVINTIVIIVGNIAEIFPASEYLLYLLSAALDATILAFIHQGSAFFELVSNKLIHLNDLTNPENLNKEVKEILKCHDIAIK